MAESAQQQSTGSEEYDLDVNNQLGESNIYESEEMMESVRNPERAEGLSTEKEPIAQEDFQQKLFQMKEENKKNSKQVEDKINKLNEENKKNSKQVEEKINNLNKEMKVAKEQLLEGMDKKIADIQQRNDKIISEIRNEAKMDREKLGKVNDRVEQNEKQVEEVKKQNEKVINEITKTSNLIKENTKRVKGMEGKINEVEGKVSKQQEEMEEKVRKMAEEKARRIEEVNEAQEVMRRRLAEVETRPAPQGISGDKPKDVTFDGEEAYPMEFLSELKEVKELYYPGDSINWIQRHLTGEAMIWWRVTKSRIANYAQFENAFIEKFWSVQTQEFIRDALEYGKYPYQCELNMTQYAERKILQCRQLIPPLSDQQIIKKLARHFTKEVQVAVLTRGVREIAQFEILLGEFMAIQQRENNNFGELRKRRFDNHGRGSNDRQPPRDNEFEKRPPYPSTFTQHKQGDSHKKSLAVKQEGHMPIQEMEFNNTQSNSQPSCSKNVPK
jgi:hypothetical protein